MKEKIFNIGLSLLLISLGLVLLGDVIGLYSVGKFFNGWWTIFIMVFAILGIGCKESTLSYGYILGIGIVLLLVMLRKISVNKAFVILFALFVIFVGIYIAYLILWKNKRKKVKNSYSQLYTSILGSIDDKFGNIKYNDGKVIAFLGIVELDLRDVKFNKSNEINLSCVCGSITLIMPSDVDIKLNCKNILGSTESGKIKKGKGNVVVNINSKCVLGSIEIR